MYLVEHLEHFERVGHHHVPVGGIERQEIDQTSHFEEFHLEGGENAENDNNFSQSLEGRIN